MTIKFFDKGFEVRVLGLFVFHFEMNISKRGLSDDVYAGVYISIVSFVSRRLQTKNATRYKAINAELLESAQ